MAAVSDKTFVMADNEQDGNLAFREQEGGVHDGDYASQYAYNGLMWFWNEENRQKETVSENMYFTEDSTVGDFPVYSEEEIREDASRADTGNMTAFMDRLFYSELCGNRNKAFYMKPAATVISARRARQKMLSRIWRDCIRCVFWLFFLFVVKEYGNIELKQ